MTKPSTLKTLRGHPEQNDDKVLCCVWCVLLCVVCFICGVCCCMWCVLCVVCDVYGMWYVLYVACVLCGVCCMWCVECVVWCVYCMWCVLYVMCAVCGVCCMWWCVVCDVCCICCLLYVVCCMWCVLYVTCGVCCNTQTLTEIEWDNVWRKYFAKWKTFYEFEAFLTSITKHIILKSEKHSVTTDQSRCGGHTTSKSHWWPGGEFIYWPGINTNNFLSGCFLSNSH